MPTVAAQAQRLVNGSAMASAEPLTPTERQVAELVAQG
jgi:DNA-binding CsgD family transcriptional regulator